MAINKSNDTITWLQVHNLLPLVGILLSAVGVFNLLSNKVELQSQKVQYLNDAVNSCLNRATSIEQQVNNQSLDIKELQTKSGVLGASTKRISSPTPVSKPAAKP